MSIDITNKILSIIVWQQSQNFMNFNISLIKLTKLAFYSVINESIIEKAMSVMLGNLLHNIFDVLQLSEQ